MTCTARVHLTKINNNVLLLIASWLQYFCLVLRCVLLSIMAGYYNYNDFLGVCLKALHFIYSIYFISFKVFAALSQFLFWMCVRVDYGWSSAWRLLLLDGNQMKRDKVELECQPGSGQLRAGRMCVTQCTHKSGGRVISKFIDNQIKCDTRFINNTAGCILLCTANRAQVWSWLQPQ